ncbi:ATP-binding protein of ABC transporter [Oceanicola granulosus HTCC2516]|uniref:ATP-binding protein of ABC transporter n=1 Tax=Oceanicola granulosus (strain ATCC BAA-861 / DSM 15982 / KCTC 12143 / HTCC2516) TaxID=314256 RepID=Q2CH20_OCEGH|nr:ATP-binding cassette domain-containing protein [Oceanicola granulosus]EAR51991.1 ATP-binding protein of ABC transporter [Oceanicola granulosus HTCC2516]
MLEVTDLTIRSSSGTVLIEDLSFDLVTGRLTCLIGPSGCGKSSVLKWLAGVLSGELRVAGQARLHGAEMSLPHPAIAYQPQQDTLFPWLTILENASLGLEIRRTGRSIARDRVRALFPTFGLEGHERSFPDQLSGGMRQRAAFLRTMVQKSCVLLLDEPFSALDAVTRLMMQGWLTGRLAEDPRSVLMVTHDLFEATQIADRVLVMAADPGRIVSDISITTPRADRTEVSLAETRLSLRSMLLENT